MTNRLLFLNGLAILMIPVHHATAYGLQAMFGWASLTPALPVAENGFWVSLPFFITMALRQLAAFAVPVFLFISGYFVSFMARSKNSDVSIKQFLPRIKVLIPPFIIWTAIRFILLRSVPESVEEILQPYHFIPLLIQFYLISPFLVPLAKKYPASLLIVTAIIQLGVQYFRYLGDMGVEMTGLPLLISQTPRWIFIGQQPFWFPFGLVFGLYSRQIMPRLMRAKRLLLLAMIGFAVLAIAEYMYVDWLVGQRWIGPSFSGFMRNFYILFVILFFLTYDVAAGRVKKYINFIGSQSMGIYMANIPAIYVTSVLMYHLIPWAMQMQLIYQIVLVIVGLVIPLILMRLVRNSDVLRPTYRYIFG